MMRTYLESKIKDRRARLLEIERERVTVAAELSAYEDSLHHFLASDGDNTESETPAAYSPPGGFEMSREWLDIMRQLLERGRSFNAADMVMVGNASGHPTKMQNARAQLAFYMKRGYIKRIRRGQYTISPKGQEVFNKEAPSDGTESASNGSGSGNG